MLSHGESEICKKNSSGMANISKISNVILSYDIVTFYMAFISLMQHFIRQNFNNSYNFKKKCYRFD